MFPRPRPRAGNLGIANFSQYKPFQLCSSHKCIVIVIVNSTSYSVTMPASNNSSRMSFDSKFKLKAVELAEQLNIRAAARHLRIDESNIRRWKKQVEAINNAPKNSCCVKPRRGAMYPDIETRVCTFVDEKRNNGLGVSRSLIRRFMKRNRYSI